MVKQRQLNARAVESKEHWIRHLRCAPRRSTAPPEPIAPWRTGSPGRVPSHQGPIAAAACVAPAPAAGCPRSPRFAPSPARSSRCGARCRSGRPQKLLAPREPPPRACSPGRCARARRRAPHDPPIEQGQAEAIYRWYCTRSWQADGRTWNAQFDHLWMAASSWTVTTSSAALLAQICVIQGSW